MKSFEQWCKEKKYVIPAVNEVPTPENAETSEGSTKRAAVRSHAYPPLYGRGQYPQEYFRPTAADAVTYQSIEK